MTKQNMITNTNQLRLEFFCIYLLMPIAMALLVLFELIPARIVPMSFVILLIASILLLNRTEGFTWRSLLAGKVVESWQFTIVFMLAITAVAVTLTWLLAPDMFLVLPRHAQHIWLVMTIGYPLFSVLTQGIIYRALYFQRYQSLFPDQRTAIASNAVLFGLAHSFYLNWVAVALTIAGGLIFAWAYVEKKSFLFAMLLHSFAGWVLFTAGLGIAYFYHGTIPVEGAVDIMEKAKQPLFN